MSLKVVVVVLVVVVLVVVVVVVIHYKFVLFRTIKSRWRILACK